MVAIILFAGCAADGSLPSEPQTHARTSSVPDISVASTPNSSTPSTSPMYVPVKPTLPAAAKRHSDAGAVAFVSYYWEALNYAWTKPDGTLLPRLSLPGCKGCENFQGAAADFQAKSWRYSSPPVQLISAIHVITDRDGVRVVTKVRKLPASIFDETGARVHTQTKGDQLWGFDALWTGSGWRLSQMGR